MTATFLADDAATAVFGRTLAGLLKPGDLVALEGDLGAGKTALARAIIRALVRDESLEVPSPTFALVQPYPGILHADLYRLREATEAEELGLFDDPDAIVLVEWPERAPAILAQASVRVALAVPPGGVGRTARVSFTDGRRL